MRRASVCSIVPPHILRNIAERGEGESRFDAQVALTVSAELRAGRVELPDLQMTIGAEKSALKKHITVYDANHTRTLPGRRARNDRDGASKDRTVNEAFDGASKTYDFYATVFGRNSVDDKGLPLDSSVHYGARYSNALWNGHQMIYGDGDGYYFTRFTKSLDVVGHELTHGVTQHTAALVYTGQPGALNEHISDVFGVLTRQYTLKQTAGRADWLIGAGLYTRRVEGVAIRSMKAPGTAYDDPVLGTDPQPAHMRDYVKTDEDDGGVHINSGIPNRAFYEAAALLGGRAWETAGKIWYRALTQRLRAHDDFQRCADLTYESAGEIFGAASAPQQAVLAAWLEVGIAISEAIVERGPRVPIRGSTGPFQPPAGAAEVPISLPSVFTPRTKENN